MLLAVFLLLWVSVIAAGVAAYGARPRRGGGSWPRWVVPAAVLSAVGLVGGLPLLAVVYSSGERSHRARSGLVLTDAQVHGRELFTQTCIRCHALADIGAPATVGPSFDRLQPSAALIRDAIAHGRARGNGQMPAGLLDAEDARDVADYLVAVAGRRPRGG